MVDVNAPLGQAPAMAPHVRTDDQIFPHIRWVPIGKSNCYLDLEKSQGNPIYKIAVDLLKNTNFFRAFTTSSREALQITPTNNNQAFIALPSSDTLINFVNELGYPKKKKATLIVILSIRFTKLIIHHLQRRHRFHPRPESLLHLPYEEHVLGYLKFSAKGVKREVFRMPIPVKQEVIRTRLYRSPLSPLGSLSQQHLRHLQGLKSLLRLLLKMLIYKALEESMKTAYAPPRGLLPPVVIKEPKSRKYQPLPEVPGKGKAKVTEEQVAHDLLSLQKPKKKSPVDQYIFQRRTFTTTGSSGHDEPSYAELEQSEHEGSEKGVPRADKRSQGEGKGQARLDPGTQTESQTGSDADREHMDLDVTDVSPQPFTEQLDEGFTATAYLKVQENLKLAVEEHVLLEDPASSSGTLSSLQHLSKDINFGDLFFSDKPSKADNDKTTVEIEVESMVSVTIQQDMSSIPPMTSPIIDLTSRPESPKIMGENDDDVGSSRSKRYRQYETVEEVLLPQVHHEFLLWKGYNKEAKSRLELYHADELDEEGFDMYFQGGLRSDEHFNAQEYWLSISQEENLSYLEVKLLLFGTQFCGHQNGYANVAWLIARWMKRKGAGTQKESQICHGQCITKLARKARVLSDEVKENQEKDKIGSKMNKNRKHGEVGKSQKQLQWIEQEKLNKTQKEGPEMHTPSKYFKKVQVKGLNLQFIERTKQGANSALV
uniref:Uncharacterized protein n=1 Tax=Tanacetum cinerariifolium TaxID=118510 RepID=A0A699HNW9_TANCI|nr:hypothetical protein [Tanacetum cinerariifolium]